jgi:ribonuclease P protein subunit RPR2
MGLSVVGVDRMAKHIARKDLRKLGDERVGILVQLSREAVKEGYNDRARRYVELARAICGKAQTEMPRDFRYCKKCLLPMMPGINCRVRLTGGKITSGCACGEVRRMPYLKEQRK